MSTVDEIMHGGVYADRRGRRWIYMDYNTWITDRTRWATEAADNRRMRLLIERDLHRDVCVGLWECSSHPVPVVHFENGVYWTAHARSELAIGVWSHTLAEAMNVARKAAVKS